MTHLLIAALLLAQEKPHAPGPAKLELGKTDREIARHPGGAAALAFSPDGKLLASAGDDKAVRLTDVDSGKQVRLLGGYKRFIRELAFSPDGKLLASTGDDSGVVVWNVDTGKELRRIGEKHTNGGRTLAFSPDGKLLATSAFDEHIGVWEVATGKELLFFRGHPRVPYGIAFSPDSKIIASGGDNDGMLRLWDARTGKSLRNWEAHRAYIYSVAFSPDGQLLASGGGDTAARLWEVATGKEIASLDGHADAVSKVVFSRDGRLLATADHVEYARVWETLTFREVRRCGRHDGWVWNVALSPSGRSLASAGKDGAVVLWDLGAPADSKRKPAALTPAELDTAWSDLAAVDAGLALKAALTLSSADTRQVLAFLDEHLQLAVNRVADGETMRRLVADLDHRSFKVRERAFADLQALGEQVRPTLRTALEAGPSAEARRRITALLDRLQSSEIPPDRLRAVRALRILEDHPSAQSRGLLKKLAGGEAADVLTREAATILARLPRPAQ